MIGYIIIVLYNDRLGLRVIAVHKELSVECK